MQVDTESNYTALVRTGIAAKLVQQASRLSNAIASNWLNIVDCIRSIASMPLLAQHDQQQVQLAQAGLQEALERAMAVVQELKDGEVDTEEDGGSESDSGGSADSGPAVAAVHTLAQRLPGALLQLVHRLVGVRQGMFAEESLDLGKLSLLLERGMLTDAVDLMEASGQVRWQALLQLSWRVVVCCTFRHLQCA
jgi:hypothetical protein